MPLRRRSFGTRLHHHVFRGQRLAKLQRPPSRLAKPGPDLTKANRAKPRPLLRFALSPPNSFSSPPLTVLAKVYPNPLFFLSIRSSPRGIIQVFLAVCRQIGGLIFIPLLSGPTRFESTEICSGQVHIDLRWRSNCRQLYRPRFSPRRFNRVTSARAAALGPASICHSCPVPRQYCRFTCLAHPCHHSS